MSTPCRWPGVDWESRRRVAQVRGRNLHYVDLGEGGTPCLLLHGIGNSWHFWLETLPHLADSRRVIAVDLPGFGASDLPSGRFTAATAAGSLADLCDQLDLDQVSVCGHSMGGIVALQLAAACPERVNRLVVASGALVSIMDLYRKPLSALRRPGLAARYVFSVLSAGMPTTRRVLDFVAGNQAARKAFLGLYLRRPGAISTALLRQVLSGVGRAGVLRAALSGFGYDYRELLRSVRTPVFIINGADDRISLPEDLDVFAEHLNDAEIVVLGDTGHWPMLERPDVFNRLLKEYLDR